MIDLSENKLMYIEPEGQCVRVQDELTNKAIAVWASCVPDDGRWRGFHRCRCGKKSTNMDYHTLCGRTTNSLLVHYVEFHRDEIPESELKKLEEEYQNYAKACAPTGN